MTQWKTYVEPKKHVLAEVTEDNALDFAREHGWTVSFYEKHVPPHPNGRKLTMRIEGVRGTGRPTDVPLWVEKDYDGQPRLASSPRETWEVQN